MWISTIIISLDFDVVLGAIGILRKNIKADRTTIEVRDFFLCMHAKNFELRFVKDDADDELHTAFVIVKTSMKERIIDEAEVLDLLDVLLPFFWSYRQWHHLLWLYFTRIFEN